jgi:ABC-type molybdenum transport system ATPase subunit/photorepair protein PhrA
MTEPVYFLNLELENVRCFREKTTLDLSDGNGNWKKWTVILGDNGTGKTTLLQILSLFEVQKEEANKKVFHTIDYI